MTIAVTPRTVRFTAEEFQRMSVAGLLGARRVELIDGRIYRMPPQRVPHMLAISKIQRALSHHAKPDDWIINQGTLRIDADTTVDPDFQWLATPEGTPEHLWPLPLLVIEVSESTYKRDSGSKLRKYAMAGIADYWIVNCQARRLEVHREPQNPTGHVENCGYRSVTHHVAGEHVSLLARPAATFAVADLLP